MQAASASPSPSTSFASPRSPHDVAACLAQPDGLARLASHLEPPSREQLQRHVRQHPLLSASLPSASALAQQIKALQDKVRQDAQRRDAARSAAAQQLAVANQNIGTLDKSLAALPPQISSVSSQLDRIVSRLSSKSIAGSARAASHGTSTSGITSLQEQLQRHRSTIQEFRSARDYFAILAQAQTLWDAALGAGNGKQDAAALPAAQSADPPLQRLTELAHLCRHVQDLASQPGGASDSSAAAPSTSTAKPATSLRMVTFLNAKLAEVYSTLVDTRSKALRQALETSGWPPLSAEQAQAQGKPVQEASVILASPSVKSAWTALTSLQLVGSFLDLTPRPSCLQYQDSKTGSGGAEAHPGSDAYIPLVSTAILVEPYLLRFRFHFDSTRATNRLDKPEWFLNHMLSLIKTLLPLYTTLPRRGPALKLSAPALTRYGKAFTDVPQTDLLHVLLRPLQAKIASSVPLLLQQQDSQILAHTISQLIQFDDDLDELMSTIAASSSPSSARPLRLSEDVLNNQVWFDAWVKSERANVEDTVEQVLDDGDAWTIGNADGEGLEEEEPPLGTWAAASSSSSSSPSKEAKTTRSARSLVRLLENITETYRPLPQLEQRLRFLCEIQLPILRTYHQRLTRSLDAFESLSSAFARAMPGGIEPGTGLPTGDADMVRGLRGLSRLLKAYLSALHVYTHVNRWQAQSFFLELSHDLLQNEEGRRLLKQQRDEAEERELDGESLGSLIRKGLKGSGSGSGSVTSRNPSATVREEESVWDEPLLRFGEVLKRASEGIRRLVVSEVVENLRPYAQMQWTDTVSPLSDADDAPPVPTPCLFPALATLNTHMTHLLPVLPPARCTPIYRQIARDLSTAVVQRVLVAGGSKRFTHAGATRFRLDWEQGWRNVLNQLQQSASSNGSGSDAAPAESTPRPLRVSLSTGLGFRPEAPWSLLVDAARILSLPGSGNPNPEQGADETHGWTLRSALAATSPSPASPSEWGRMKRDLRLSRPTNPSVSGNGNDGRGRGASGSAATGADGGETGLTPEKAREVLRRRVEWEWEV